MKTKLDQLRNQNDARLSEEQCLAHLPLSQEAEETLAIALDLADDLGVTLSRVLGKFGMKLVESTYPGCDRVCLMKDTIAEMLDAVQCRGVFRDAVYDCFIDREFHYDGDGTCKVIYWFIDGSSVSITEKDGEAISEEVL